MGSLCFAIALSGVLTTSDLSAQHPCLDAHRDDPEFGYRFLVDEAKEAGESMA